MKILLYICWIVLWIGFLTCLLVYNQIGEVNFSWLLPAMVLFGFILIFISDRLVSFKGMGMEAKLVAEAKQIRDDLLLKRTEFQEAMRLALELTVVSSLSASRFTDLESFVIRQELTRSHVRRLSDHHMMILSRLEPIIRLYQRLDNREYTPEERDQLLRQINEEIRKLFEDEKQVSPEVKRRK